MTTYLVELSVIHISLVLGYWFFLRKEHQYAKMRFYLLCSTFLALTIPFLKLPKLFLNRNEPVGAASMEAIPVEAVAITPAVDISTWNYDLLIWMYIAISTLFLAKFFSSVVYLIYLDRKSHYIKFNDLYVRKVKDIEGSFTFFNWIFIGEEIDRSHPGYDAILKHEKAHASLGHTYDLIFFELFKVCFWWLPTIWLIQKEIKKIHEYQADAYALKSYSIGQYSAILINSALKINGLSLASSFHDGLILKRLKAMKQQAKNVSPWKFGALSVLATILFTVFACSEEPNQRLEEVDTQSDKMVSEVFTVVEELPQYPGGIEAFYRYMGDEMNYPKEARIKGVEGRVDVQFVVEKDGTLSSVEAIKGIGTGCDDEAVRVVQNAALFTPGKQRGRAVRVRMVMPIIFKLNVGKTNEDNTTQGVIIIEEAESNQGQLQVYANHANGEWSGTVYSAEGDVLPGASIVVAGTSTGTVSGLDGTFKVKTSDPKDLNISFVGYESVRLEGNRNSN